MSRLHQLFLLSAALLAAACSNESDLPEATGKASIRAINVIPGAGTISFLSKNASSAPPPTPVRHRRRGTTTSNTISTSTSFTPARRPLAA